MTIKTIADRLADALMRWGFVRHIRLIQVLGMAAVMGLVVLWMALGAADLSATWWWQMLTFVVVWALTAWLGFACQDRDETTGIGNIAGVLLITFFATAGVTVFVSVVFDVRLAIMDFQLPPLC